MKMGLILRTCADVPISECVFEFTNEDQMSWSSHTGLKIIRLGILSIWFFIFKYKNENQNNEVSFFVN